MKRTTGPRATAFLTPVKCRPFDAFSCGPSVTRLPKAWLAGHENRRGAGQEARQDDSAGRPATQADSPVRIGPGDEPAVERTGSSPGPTPARRAASRRPPNGAHGANSS